MIANKLVKSSAQSSLRSMIINNNTCVHTLNRMILPSSNTLSQQQTRNYAPKQRRINLTMQNPFDMLEDYKKKMATIERLDENTPIGKVIYTDDVLLQRNIEIYEKLKASGEIPEEELLAEEPQVQEYVDFLKKTEPGPGEYTHSSKRSGVIAVKCGMIPFWDKYMNRVSLTALWVPDCQVVQAKTNEKEGYTALQLGAGSRSVKQITKPMYGHFQGAGVEPKQVLTEVKVTTDAMLPVGFRFDVRHFRLGQFVDVTGRTKGKGFQGPMKRWGFAGQPATHGVSVVHRSHGSTGNKIGKVFPGKKMAGHMGCQQKTVLNLYVHMMDIKRNLIYVSGAVPGSEGSYVLLQDARRKKPSLTNPPPFPSYTPVEGEDVASLSDSEAILVADGQKPFDWSDSTMSYEQIQAMLDGEEVKVDKKQDIKTSNKGGGRK